MKVIAFPRNKNGTGASRRLRNSGLTPGIIYGGKEAPTNISLDHNALFHSLKKEAFHSSILEIEVGGKTEQVLLRDFQLHAFKRLVLHADFQRVEENKLIRIKVPLHFINANLSPAVKISSGIISHVMNEIDIVCLPKNLPEFIDVDLSKMSINSSFHVSDLILPSGVSTLNSKTDSTIATATVPRGGKVEASLDDGISNNEEEEDEKK
tara:strand:- start:266 stop:892 length:627 start_codon:yes stop_codon:yes gene_type:complete